ncbi:CCAAT/enhancer-binding protein zeta [Cryomyces antarcticus]
MGRKRTAAEARSGPTVVLKGGTATTTNEKKDRKDPNLAKVNGTGGKPTSLIFEPRPDWHARELPEVPIPAILAPPPRRALEEIQQYAVALLEAENKEYETKHASSDASHKFMSTIMASGTLEDKVSALTLRVQESPLHAMKVFDNLLGLAKKRSRNQALMAVGALKDLLGQGMVLPPTRKLRTFAKQPGLYGALHGKYDNWKTGDPLPGKLEKIHLVVWAYEDWLKSTFFELLKVLEGWCSDEVVFARSRAVTFVWELLKEKPEQEENLLRLLVNKLGDTDKKIASRASHLLLQLQETHPAMKAIIINNIESESLYRPGQSSHAKYYAIITLNQTVLSTKEQNVANKLLEIYFGLFVQLLKTPKKAQNQPDGPPVSKTNSHGQIQGGGGKPGKKAAQKAKSKETAGKSDEELNEKMIAAVLTGVNRAFPYAKIDDAVFEAQMDTIFKVTHSSNFNTSIQALQLIQQISSSKHYSSDRFYRTLYESLLDSRLLTSSKQIMYLNLLYKSLKSDVDVKRVKAFVKRLMQIITLHDPPFVINALYLVRELEATFPSIKSMMNHAEEADEDEEERFVDAPENPKEGTNSTVAAIVPQTNASQHKVYDGRKRHPESAFAERSCLWEITPFLAHFHPTVSLFASHLLNSNPLPAKPDPTLHTLIHFLDRFAYRNAKSAAKSTATRGTSIMQPLAGTHAADLLIRSRDGGRAEAPLNTEAFWRKKGEDVKADEAFFHQYFGMAGKRTTAQSKKKAKEEEEEEDDEGRDDAGEDEIWKALVDSRPEVEGPESDDDLDMDDLDSAYSGSEVETNEGLDDDPDDGDVDGDAEDGLADLESEDDAMLDDDADLPSDFDGFAEAPKGQAETGKGKGKDEQESRGRKRRKLKHLPTFASADDYAKLLEGDEDQ